MRHVRARLNQLTLLLAAGSCGTLVATAAAQWSAVFGSNGPDGMVNDLLAGPSSQAGEHLLYAAGDFPSVTTPSGAFNQAHIVAWDGQAWLPGPGIPVVLNALAVHPLAGEPTLFAAGSSGASSSYPLWHLTGGIWVGANAGSQSFVTGLASYDIGQGRHLVLSSGFASPSVDVARWDDGALSAMGAGLTDVTKAFAVYDDGHGPQLYAAAGAHGGQSATYVARFDGNDWATPSGGTGSWAYALQVYNDGSGPALFVGGSFQWAGSTAIQAAYIARYKNGAWTPVGSGLDGTVRAMTTFDDGSGEALYVAGDFSNAGGQPALHIARWRGGQWSALGSGIPGAVRCLTVFDDDGAGPIAPALYVGGSFTSAGGLPARGVARWGGQSPCYANCDQSTTSPTLNVLDFVCFLNRFVAQDPYANCDGSTIPPVLNVSDFACFLNKFAAGCS